jgi:hypothetical protein
MKLAFYGFHFVENTFIGITPFYDSGHDIFMQQLTNEILVNKAELWDLMSFVPADVCG